MSELILVDAPFRTMQALYGNPPFVPPPDETIGMSAPICTPSRSDNTVCEWYAEQEARYGLYAALKAKRPKRNWFGGRKEEPVEQEAPAYQPKQLTEQPQRYTVQEQLRRQRQIADSNGVSETATSDGIYWFTVSEDSEVSR